MVLDYYLFGFNLITSLETLLKKVLLATSLMCLSSFALAHGCPGEMKKIDAAMPTAKLSSADMSKVQSLRAKGEEQHKAGQHTESMASLGEAKKVMGIQ